MLCSILGIRPALKSKIDDAYKIAYLKCALNMNANSKNEAFSFNSRWENEGQNWYLWVLFWEINNLTWWFPLLTELLQFSQPDTWHCTMSFKETRLNYCEICLHSAFPNKVRLFWSFLIIMAPKSFLETYWIYDPYKVDDRFKASVKWCIMPII